MQWIGLMKLKVQLIAKQNFYLIKERRIASVDFSCSVLQSVFRDVNELVHRPKGLLLIMRHIRKRIL